jgi:hypothetical protein
LGSRGRAGSRKISTATLTIIYSADLALFVLVFVIIRLRRARPEAVVGIIILAALAYLATFVLLIVLGARNH